MKILMLLANPFKPDDRVNNEACALTKANNQITIIAWDRESGYPQKEEKDGVKIERIRLNAGYGNKSILAPMVAFQFLIFYKALFTRDFEAIHCHDLDTLIPGLLVAKIRRKKIIYDAHEDYPGAASVILPKWIVSIMYWIEKMAVKHVDGLVTPHPFMIKKFKNISKKALVMNCKILARDESKNKTEIKNLKKKLGIENKFVLMFIGGCTIYRFVSESAEIFIKNPLKEFVFLILGRSIDESGEYISKIEDKKNVIFLPSVSLEELPLYIQLGDLFHCYQDPKNINYKIAIPNKLFDSMTGRKPIIVSQGTACEDIVKKAKCGFCLPYGNTKKLREIIEWSKNHMEEIQSMGESGRKAVEKEYNWEEMGNRLINLYKTL